MGNFTCEVLLGLKTMGLNLRKLAVTLNRIKSVWK
jgi:hypothetical protein